MRMSGTTKKWIAGGALVLGGFGAGAALAVTSSASATSGAASGNNGSSNGEAPRSFDPSKSIRPDDGFQSHGPNMQPGFTITASRPRATSSNTTRSDSRLVTT